MKIPLAKVDILEEDIQRVQQVLLSGWVMQGPRVEAFEAAVAAFCGVPYAVATSSGTTALHLALAALAIGPGDEVIAPSFSWIASANAIHYCGATPVFCDADLRTYNMDPVSVASLITPRTRAILVVHQFGMPCDMEALSNLAQKHGIELIEDAACAIGSEFKNRPMGSGDKARAVCLSFHPRKVVTTGEGGMVLTRDGAIAESVRILRNHGQKSASDPFTRIGYNYRMTDMQAALGLGQIARLPQTIAKRRAVADQYFARLSRRGNFLLPFEPEGSRSNYQSFMIRLQGSAAAERDRIARDLAEAGIATRPSISPIHRQPCYAHKEIASLPQTDRLAMDGLVLPLFPSMSETEVERVCEHLGRAASAVA